MLNVCYYPMINSSYIYIQHSLEQLLGGGKPRTIAAKMFSMSERLGWVRGEKERLFTVSLNLTAFTRIACRSIRNIVERPAHISSNG